MAEDNLDPKLVTIADLPRKRAPGFLSIYANNAGSASTRYDLRLIFGQIVFGPKEEPHIEDTVSVTMPWEHVVPLRDLLNRLIPEFEAKYGKIRTAEPDESTEHP